MDSDEGSRKENEDDDDFPFGRKSGEYIPGATYRWECPICHMKGIATVRNPARVLRTHLYETNGDGHGERGTFPGEFPEGEGLDEFIKKV